MTIPKLWPKPIPRPNSPITETDTFFPRPNFLKPIHFFATNLKPRLFFETKFSETETLKKKNWNVNLCYRVSQAKVLNRITCAGFATGASFNRSTCSPFPRGIGKPLIYSVRCSDCAKLDVRNFWLGHPVTSCTSPRLYKVIKRRFTKWFENAQFQ